MVNIKIKQGEAKNLQIIVKDGNGVTTDLSPATLFLGVKRQKSDAEYTFSKDDDDFDKAQAAAGMVTVFLTAADTDQTPGPYAGELKVTFPGTPAVIDKSSDLILVIEEAVTA